MCGIAGIIGLRNHPIDYEDLVEMTDELGNRGPDGEGFLITNDPVFCSFIKTNRGRALVKPLAHRQSLGLGHRRLSIIDLSTAANQPMADIDERYWLVFNGQIYNHIELRKELELMGYKFRTNHSDSEVILNAYKCWGLDCLNHFNGKWAFCLWDSIKNTFFIARDKMGKQPLFYTTFNNNFYFASELNAIIRNGKIRREVSELAIYDYLTYTFVPSPKTIYKNINKLKAAHYIFFKPGEEIKTTCYWDSSKQQPSLNLNEDEIVESIKKKILESLELRIRADVKLGVLLSGGLDSSIILAGLNKNGRRSLPTYCVGFESKQGYKNEFEYARKVAAHFGASLREEIVTENDFFNVLPNMAYFQDEPVADTANIPLYLISKRAQSDNVKVLLSGEGADELFIGYEHWRLIYQYEKFLGNKPNLTSFLDFVHKRSAFKNKGIHYQMWGYKIKNNWPVFWSGTELRTEETKRKALSKNFLNEISDYNSFKSFSDLHESIMAQKPYDAFKWMTVVDLQNRLPDLLLERLDRMMMTASVEGRNPFLDINLVEFVLRIPPGLKIKEKTEKYLLKKAFKEMLPDEILNRPKDSFTVPLNLLFNKARIKKYSEVIREFNRTFGIFREEYLTQLERPENSKEFWNVLNLALWHEQHKLETIPPKFKMA